MKKIIVLFLIPLILTGIISCTKTGPAGPAGAAGPTGPAGQSVVAVDSFAVNTSDWVLTQPGYYKITLTKTYITQQIVEQGVVSLRCWSTNYPDWYPWPYTVAGQAGYRFNYDVNSLVLFADNWTSGAPYNLKIKVVVFK